MWVWTSLLDAGVVKEGKIQLGCRLESTPANLSYNIPVFLLLGPKMLDLKKKKSVCTRERWGREKERTRKSFRSPFGKQASFAKQHFDELSANESETQGLNLPWNTHKFKDKGQIAWQCMCLGFKSNSCSSCLPLSLFIINIITKKLVSTLFTRAYWRLLSSYKNN